MTTKNSAELYTIDVDQRSINQILRDDGGTEEGMTKLWEMIGFPIVEGEAKVVSLTIIIQNLAAIALGQYHPLGAKMSVEELEKFLTKQGFTPREIATLEEKTGLEEVPGKKTFASIITRMVKAIVRPSGVNHDLA